MPSKLELAAQRHRRELLRIDQDALAAMVDAYRPAQAAVQAQLLSIQAQIKAAEAAGEVVDKAWLFKQQRAADLEQQITAALADFAPKATSIAKANQTTMVTIGQKNAKELAGVAVGKARTARVLTSWSTLPTSALEDLVGFSLNGSPLRVLFDELGPRVSRQVRDQLATGLALGRNPLVVAREVQGTSGMGLARAMTISRTESLRAYRESTRRAYDQSKVVQGWLWLSARSTNTCAACWGMDGQRFDTSDSMEAHPNCRCTMVPDTGGTDIGSGEDTFNNLGESDQLAVLGPAKHDAFKSGKIGLQDLVTRRTSKEWGTSVQVASLKQATSK